MLAACEMSGRVATAFAQRGWESWSADLLPSEELDDYQQHLYLNGGSYRHYQGDVLDLFDIDHPVNAVRRAEELAERLIPLWDLVIAFPPCTDLSLAGARYWKQKQQPRWNGIEWISSLQQESANFFMEMVNAPSPLVAVENPVGIMGRKKDPLYRVPDQVVQPWMFGDALIKKTCLWLTGLPPLRATRALEDYPELARVATGGGSYRVDLRTTGKANNGHEDSRGRAYRHIMRSLTPPGFARAMADQWGPFAEEYYS